MLQSISHSPPSPTVQKRDVFFLRRSKKWVLTSVFTRPKICLFKKKFFILTTLSEKGRSSRFSKTQKIFFINIKLFSNFRFWGKKIFPKNLRQTGMNKQKNPMTSIFHPRWKKGTCLSFSSYFICSLQNVFGVRSNIVFVCNIFPISPMSSLKI